MFRTIVVLAIIGSTVCQSSTTDDWSVDDYIKMVFGEVMTTEGSTTVGIEKSTTPVPTVTSTRTVTLSTTVSTFSPPVKGDNPCSVGECFPYYLCLNGTIITDGEGTLDPRFGEEEESMAPQTTHPCPEFFHTCCSIKGEEPKILPVEKREGCGWRNPKGVGFKVRERDNESQFAEFPWTIAVMAKQVTPDSTFNVYQCAGTLIHPSVVLTAAHCIADKAQESLLIRAGEWDTQTKDEPFPHQDLEVAEVRIHEQFRKSNLFNDIALLFLKEPVNIVENVNTACLPPVDANFDNKRCFAAGWGKDKFGRVGIYQAILKKVELPVVPIDKCQDVLRKSRLGKYFILNPSFMCAGGELGIDTCTGDGGAPLMCESPAQRGRYYAAGLVSWGIGCNEGRPGVYVNVPYFMEWIGEQFDQRKLDKSSYQPQIPQNNHNFKRR